LPQLQLLSSDGGDGHLRHDGVAWVHYRKDEEEEGERTVMFWWEFAQFVAPMNARIAFFSFTIYADEEHEPSTEEQLRVLRQLPSSVNFLPLQPFELQDAS
jgi:hypothetical protein